MNLSLLKKLFLLFSIFSCLSLALIIISSYLDHLPIHSCPHNSSSTNLTINKSPYLWCVNHYGPNNQLRDFVKCCIIAMLSNYTLVIPPLYPHYGDHLRGIQWFDHFYDLKELSSVLNFVTLDRLIPLKSNTKEVFFDCYIQQNELIHGRTWYSQYTLNSIQNHYGIKLIFHQYVNLSRNFKIENFYKQSNNCSSIFLHIHYTAFGQYFSSPNRYIQSIFEHLRRNPIIQRISSELIKHLPKLLINKKPSQKKFNTLAVVHMRLGDYNVMSVSKYVEQILYLINNSLQFTHLHIMCPYLNTSHVEYLSKNLPVPFTTTQHIVPHAGHLLDDYLFDVFEQEIAYLAPIFLASPWTTYSATILMQKVYQKKGRVFLLSSKPKTRPFLVTEKNVRYF